MDLIDELKAVERTVGLGVLPAGPARVMTMARVFDVEIPAVWAALTNTDELTTWFAPATGDLRAGGRYELEGNASGQVRRCDGSSHLQVTWVVGAMSAEPDSSIVDLQLSPIGRRTRFRLGHVTIVPEGTWRHFGPGAVGVEWDLALLALAGYLAGAPIGTVEDLSAAPAMRDVIAASSEAWGEAYRAAGASAQEVAPAVVATTGFYTPPMDA